MDILYHGDDNDISISTWEAGNVSDSMIKLKNKQVEFGYRTYLCCPECHRSFEELHHVGGMWTCRMCAGGLIITSGPSKANRHYSKLAALRARLLGLDGKGPARGMNRQRIIGELQRTPFVDRLYSDLAPVFEAAIKKERGRRRRSLPRLRPGLNTRDALAVGSRLTVLPALPAPESHTRLHLCGSATSESMLPPAQVGIIEHFPSLDIRLIAKAWQPDSEGRWAHTLVWRAGSGGTMLLLADLDSRLGPHLRVAHEGSSGRVVQLIKLELRASGQGNRWYMLCPLTGRWCDLLSFRNGFFASPTAQRLVHQSQRLFAKAH